MGLKGIVSPAQKEMPRRGATLAGLNDPADRWGAWMLD